MGNKGSGCFQCGEKGYFSYEFPKRNLHVRVEKDVEDDGMDGEAVRLGR